MTREWTKWGRSERIRCCLYIETTSDSFIQRSILFIRTSFKDDWKQFSTIICRIRMTLWKLNDSGMSRMIADWQKFRGRFFSIAPKPPPFHLVPSFLRHFRMLQMSRNEKYNGDISFQCQFTHLDFIRSSSLTQEWCPTDGMRVKWGVFLEASRIPWFWNQFHSTIIPPIRAEIPTITSSFHPSECHFCHP